MQFGGDDLAATNPSTPLGQLNLCYGDGLEGNGGHYCCPRMGSIYDGNGRPQRTSLNHIDSAMAVPAKTHLVTDCVCVFVWSVHGALLLPTIRGLPLCVFVCTYGVLLVHVCMHSDYECS